MRNLDAEGGLVNSAIADLLLLYASTSNWFQALRDYKVQSEGRAAMKKMAYKYHCNTHKSKLIQL